MSFHSVLQSEYKSALFVIDNGGIRSVKHVLVASQWLPLCLEEYRERCLLKKKTMSTLVMMIIMIIAKGMFPIVCKYKYQYDKESL